MLKNIASNGTPNQVSGAHRNRIGNYAACMGLIQVLYIHVVVYLAVFVELRSERVAFSDSFTCSWDFSSYWVVSCSLDMREGI